MSPTVYGTAFLRSQMFRPPSGGRKPDRGGSMHHTPIRLEAKVWRADAPPGVLRYTFPGTPAKVREARKLVEELFTGTGREDDAGLIVDELANNSILYTRSGKPGGWFGVEIAFGTLVRVGVVDLGGAGRLIGAPAPAPSQHDDHDDPEGLEGSAVLGKLDAVALGGRGLAIVAELAVTTGACGSDALGHFVWADLPLPTPVAETPGEALLLVP